MKIVTKKIKKQNLTTKDCYVIWRVLLCWNKLEYVTFNKDEAKKYLEQLKHKFSNEKFILEKLKGVR